MVVVWTSVSVTGVVKSVFFSLGLCLPWCSTRRNAEEEGRERKRDEPYAVTLTGITEKQDLVLPW